MFCTKINYCFICALLFVLLVSCQDTTKKEESNRLVEYISCEQRPIFYREIEFIHDDKPLSIPDQLSQEQALEDIDVFEYLLTTSYSGYEYWKSKGVDFDAYFSGLRQLVHAYDSVDSGEFEKKWSQILDSISDGHIGFQGKNAYGAYKHQTVYFSDIVLRKTKQGEYFVSNSQCNLIKKGDRFTHKEPSKYLFQTLSPPGEQFFLLGAFSAKPVSSFEFSFNKNTYTIPLNENRLSFVKNTKQSPFDLSYLDSIPLLNISSFANEIYPEMKQFMDAGLELGTEKLILVNAMNNGGGSSLFPQSFIHNLNGRVSWDTHWGELYSPAIVGFYAAYNLNAPAAQSPGFRQMIEKHRRLKKAYQLAPMKKWVCARNDEFEVKGDPYEGILLLLVNRHVLSAGEAFVGSSACLDKRILIGENTGGSGMFSSACSYVLPHSRFIAKLPRHFISIPDFEECRGFLPDYWLNTHEPLKEVLAWQKQPQSYRFKYSCDFTELLEKSALFSDMVFPENMQIQTPGKNISAEYAAFSGKWFGLTDGTLNTGIVVESINKQNEAEVIYAWGTAPKWNIHTAGWQRLKGRFQNDQLLIEHDTLSYKIRLQLLPDGKMEHTYTRPGILSKTILTRLDR